MDIAANQFRESLPDQVALPSAKLLEDLPEVSKGSATVDDAGIASQQEFCRVPSDLAQISNVRLPVLQLPAL